MPALNLRQLEAFRAVMIGKTITRAADALFISQPAVSRLIADLEHSVGFTLFERRRGRLLPTPEGLALYEEVERSFTGIEQIARTAREIREFRTGSLLIAALPALSLGYLPGLIQRFSRDHPDISISLQIRSSQKVAEWMIAQQGDLGLTAIEGDNPAFAVEPLLNTRMVCVLPADHPLRTHPSIRPGDLAGEDFISLGSEHRLPIDRVFAEAGVKRRLRIETQLSAAACLFALEGAGVSIVDPVSAAAFSARGVVVRPFEPVIPFDFQVLYPAYRPRSRLTEQFVALLRADLQARFAHYP